MLGGLDHFIFLFIILSMLGLFLLFVQKHFIEGIYLYSNEWSDCLIRCNVYLYLVLFFIISRLKKLSKWALPIHV